MYTYVFANVIGGLCVLSSYAFFIPLLSHKELWANMSNSRKILVLVSLLIAIYAFIYSFSIIVKSKSELSTYIFIGIILFYLGASSWAPLVLLDKKSLVLLSLMMTTLGAFLMAIYSPTFLTKFLMFIVFLHCLFTDNIVWYNSYVKQ